MARNGPKSGRAGVGRRRALAEHGLAGRAVLLTELIQGLGVEPARGDAAPAVVRGVTERSDRVAPGTVFIARRGARHDGRAFAEAALRAGAIAIVSDDREFAGRLPRGAGLWAPDLALSSARMGERFHGEPSAHLRLIGITGTNGKTTIAHGVQQILMSAGRRCGLIGTVVTDDGAARQRSSLTTPMSIELSETLARMVRHGCDSCAMEVSSHALAQGRTAALAFRIGVFTNLTGDHLDYHATMDAYADAKAILFQSLPPDGWAIFNREDPWAERVCGRTRARPLSCAVAGRADCVAAIDEQDRAGMSLRLAGPWGCLDARVGLLGRHNAMNLLQACAAAWAAGAPTDALRAGLERIEAPPGRLERAGAGVPEVYVDFAHSDDSLRTVLGVLRGVAGRGKLILVFGCGGDRDRTKRARMGRAAQEADRIFVTSDNPRTEDPRAIIDEILRGMDPSARLRTSVIEAREAAIESAILSAHDDDIVLIAGKGHETEQIMPDGQGGTVRRHFDDREVASAALRRRAPSGAARRAVGS
ncbi:MAG: UDP-N-acetylmuramoyl-L-alanyl-D-glutamate--2,6-diaminopimelate ligase [Phycisphaeraceae bacterium]|nr:UDP-N-acetylmuramoyl-L-alanyl-D-glutamate--2,6-diaminopimelate ligase [Phycisphaeraceae bacterium]